MVFVDYIDDFLFYDEFKIYKNFPKKKKKKNGINLKLAKIHYNWRKILIT